ncbi:protein FAR1-RElateD SEQUENCE [Trifolium pratense]|uniref:Protein FAR1-RElateD SEQUENCE n=1 Tax=Trifolium pratense TaxID=57577 RepID=A0A2K3NUK4_TRIPR|nr:protein FAR1-RElateD SEQUENCE [Trifolium pratense]
MIWSGFVVAAAGVRDIRCGRMESERQLENVVGVEDRADDEHRDSSFDNDEYSSSVGEIGGGSDEEIIGNVEGDIAYKFYHWYGRATGFSVRKSRFVRNAAGVVVQQSFLCYREGYRENISLTPEKRQHEQKTILEGIMCGMLTGHRKMMGTDIQDIESHGNVGIRPYQMYGAMANSAGNFHKVEPTDVWCDGESRKNFEVFGDVFAFDATYRKNKYNCPFVVFSGVNRHNQTVVFATGLVTMETEETYVWLLEQFMCEMQGKTPLSVITYCDLAMKNAIIKVEVEADFQSNYGEPVIQSGLRSIEKSAANQYTKKIFNMFKLVLNKCMLLKVLEVQEMSRCRIYKVGKYCGNGEAYYVTHLEYAVDKFKCSCLRMESIDLPYDHIVCVLVFLDIAKLPTYLVLPSLVKMSKDVAELVYDDLDDCNCDVDILNAELKRLKAKHPKGKTTVGSSTMDVNVLDPPQVRTKGCGFNPTPTPRKRRRGPTCGECGNIGHNKRFCPNSKTVADDAVTPSPFDDNVVSS